MRVDVARAFQRVKARWHATTRRKPPATGNRRPRRATIAAMFPYEALPFSRILRALALTGAALGVAAPAPAAPAPGPTPEPKRTAGVFTFYLENDYFGGSDRHYTNGTKFSWLSGDLTAWGLEGWRRSFVEALPFVNRADGQKNLGLALGQNMYTPEETDLHVPDPADRPYAGWTYLEFNFVSRTMNLMDTFSLQVGMIGRHSYAQETQNQVHRWLKNAEAKGWAYQLDDEIGVNAILQRRWRLFARSLSNAVGVDFVPHAGLSLGNVQTYANLGTTVRLGFNLPNDFGVDLLTGNATTHSPLDARDPRINSRTSFSFFVFGGGDGRAVARDIFLDGNTWEDSPSVDKKPFVGDAFYGIGIILKRWQLTYTEVLRTKEFKGQRENNYFGSITLSRTW